MMTDRPRLTVEYVPGNAMYASPKQVIDDAQWRRVREQVLNLTGGVCQGCQTTGIRLSCFPKWHFADEQHIQTLTGFEALCEKCIAVKGFHRVEIPPSFSRTYEEEEAYAQAEFQSRFDHLQAVNGWSTEQTEAYLAQAEQLQLDRSRYRWKADLSVLRDYLPEFDPDALQEVKPITGGLIGKYGLQDWWSGTFTEEERQYLILHSQKVFGVNHQWLIEGETPLFAGRTAGEALLAVVRMMSKPIDRFFHVRMLEEARRQAISHDDLRLLWWIYVALIQIHYVERDQREDAFNLAIEACEQMISLGPAYLHLCKEQKIDLPREHLGFKQLAIIREKEGNYQEVLRLCQQALTEGWPGDWSKRAARCERKIAKT